jgi:hypothetical protein
VDNFRDPWGFSIENTRGHGGDGDYDGNIAITRQDLEAVFAGLGGPGTAAYEEAEDYAEEMLSPSGGLCYGFGLTSWELYLDTHGKTLPLGWSTWSGSTLTTSQLPFTVPETATGSHALTHDLLRASISQFSPEAKARTKYPHSSAELEAMLDSGFSKGQPVLLSPKWKVGTGTEGHTLLAYNYRPTGEGGIDVDVVDPNVPANASPQTAAYPHMQVHVHPDGSWNYAGSFTIGKPYSDPISGGSGSLEMAVDPRIPGGLNITANVKHGPNSLSPRGGATVNAISYGGSPGHGLPSDVESAAYSADAVNQRLVVPSRHHVVTATITGPATGSADLTGSGFIDTVGLGAGAHPVTLNSTDGSLSVPLATSKTALSVTRVSRGVQYTVNARFSGKVKYPTITVAPGGAVTIMTAGGNGSVSLSTGTYLPSGNRAVTRRSRTALHGRARIHRHTPKVKIKRHKRKSHRTKPHSRRHK